MKRILFGANKEMYKANLHCHTTISDGTYTPEQIKEIYQAEDYSVVAYTDHMIIRAHNHLTDDKFLALNAFEMNVDFFQEVGRYHNAKTYHILFFAPRADVVTTPEIPPLNYHDVDGINDYIAKLNEEGYLACYCHPYWSLQTYPDYIGLKGLFATEIYNHGCDQEGFNGSYGEVYDDMLRAGTMLYCIATDDNHNLEHEKTSSDNLGSDSFGGFTMINSKSLAYLDVMNALRAGDFYASKGPSIYEMSLEDNLLRVECSESEAIIVYTDGRTVHSKVGKNLTQGTFELRGFEKYIRIECRDKEYKSAYSNAYFLPA